MSQPRLWIVVILAVLGLCGLPVVLIFTLGGGPAFACTAATLSGSDAPVNIRVRVTNPLGVWNTAQLRNATTIVAVGNDRGIPPRGWVIAVATAMTESRLINTPFVTDHDSVGLFQQRPSAGWGSPQQLLDPAYAATKFYAKLLTIPGWQNLPLTQAAQAVQRSGYPDRYARFEHDAETVVAAIAGVGSIKDLPGASPIGCASPAHISASGWTSPVAGAIGDGFGPRNGRLHAGVDLIAPRYSIIRAASGGVVVHVGCDQATGNCDLDGSKDAHGCGWYVDVEHAQGIATRYCHLVRQPDVTDGQTIIPGQPIGAVGMSGHATGPHLHFEIHQNVTCNHGRCDLTTTNAIDPVGFLTSVGVRAGDA
jgi:murein DD-endopeptidase MepM/ murein hydrolase activator NlpD